MVAILRGTTSNNFVDLCFQGLRGRGEIDVRLRLVHGLCWQSCLVKIHRELLEGLRYALQIALGLELLAFVAFAWLCIVALATIFVAFRVTI